MMFDDLEIPPFLRRSTEEIGMGRPKGSKNKTQKSEAGSDPGAAAAIKEPLNGSGHNGPPELTDEQKQALFFIHLKKIRAFKEKLASLSGELRAAYKVAKSELGKDARKMIEDALLLDTEDGQARMEEDIARKALVARWMGLPLGAQADLFDGDMMPAVDRARMAGKAARLNGEQMKPPHDPSVPQFQAWAEGWHAGEKALVEAQKRDDAVLFDAPPIGSEVPTFSEIAAAN